ncbi:MAG: HlyD family efflux transporter periplasmic adaptor subunit [Bacteroidales bacterium]|nr:HlyD family efflux transporter periplasmic adaptor subunit [Bacteroidales bacterium]
MKASKMNIIMLAIIFLATISCQKRNNHADAYGNFEAIETIVSSQVQGEILHLTLEKGMQLTSNQIVGVVDTVTYYLKYKQLLAQRKALESKSGNILSEINVQEEMKSNLKIEQNRLQKLLQDGAATQKQMDDIDGQLRIIDSKIQSVKTQNNTLFNEVDALDSQIELAKDQLSRCTIKNPLEGIVLEKYIEAHELAVPGKALYKIANLDELDLRVYISGSQLDNIAIGDSVIVMYDKDEKSNHNTSGIIRWISDHAEFTPKIIQTKEERVNMVYAVLVRVKNDGALKIGMPGEVKFK